MMNSRYPSAAETLAMENERCSSVPGMVRSTYWPGWKRNAGSAGSFRRSKLMSCVSSASSATSVCTVRTGSRFGSVSGRRRGDVRIRLVGRDVRLALGVGHLVQQHVGAAEGDAPHVVEGPELLRVVQVEMRLGDQGLAVVADVAQVGDDL